LWTVLPPFASGPLRGAAVDASGLVWVVAGGGIATSSVESTEVVDSEIRYVRRGEQAHVD
jgi:hypothetical protein